MELKIKNVITINSILNVIKSKTLSIEHLKKIIRLKSELEKELKLIIDLQSEILQKHNVTINEETRREEYKDVNVKKDFNKDMKEMNESLIEITNTNFIDEDTFYKYMTESEVSIEMIVILEEVLVTK